MESELHVRSVQFGLCSPEYIRRVSVVNVTEPAFYKNGLPKPNGCNDLRMGTTDRDFCCATCKKNAIDCPGHFGRIEFFKPVINPTQIKIVFKVLRCICFYCSGLLLHVSKIPNKSFRKKKILMHISNASKSIKKCRHCQGLQPNYTLKVYEISHTFPQKKKEFESEEEYKHAIKPLTTNDIRNKLSSISDEDVAKIGLCPKRSRPEWMIWTCMLVPPPCIRPSVVISAASKSRGHDFLSIKLQEIVKLNRKIGTMLSKDPNANTRVSEQDLQSQIAMYLDKDINVSRRSRGRSTRGDRRNRRNNITRSVSGRLGGKKGRLRQNICGKRTNFSSRTVITPDSTMDIDQIGIPERIALKQTIPIRVTNINLVEMRQRVRNGSGTLDGASKLEDKDGRIINLDFCSEKRLKEIDVKPGMIVHRFLNKGDWVLLNRQPTLHKGSMMGHQVQIHKGMTIRLPVPDTTPYNADYDGDEMNMHVPQTLDSRAELKMVGIENNMVCPKLGNPAIACVQDTVIGLYLMCRPGCFVQPSKFFSLSMHCRYTDVEKIAQKPAILKPKKLYTGYQLASLVVPNTVSINNKTSGEQIMADRYNKSLLRVDNGYFMYGCMTKKVSGRSAGGLVQVVSQSMGCRRGLEMVSDMQRLATRWLCSRGCSIGVGDCRASNKQNSENIKLALQQRINKANEMEHEGQTEQALQLLQGSLMACGNAVVKSISDDNMFGVLVQSGSKGSVINLAQVIGCVGQQSNTGINRCDNRTAYARPGKKRSRDLGFCQSSFYEGLHPIEFFHHTVSGRSGLIDTAVKTSQIGYVQRRLIKALESFKVGYDMRVFKTGRFLQHKFGGTGMSCEKLRPIYLEELYMPIHLINKRHGNVEGRRIIRLRNIIKQNRAIFSKDDACAKGNLMSPFNPYTIGLKPQHQWTDGSLFSDKFLTHRRRLIQLINTCRKILGGKQNAVVIEFVILCGLSFNQRRLNNIKSNVYDEVERIMYCSTYDPGESIGTLSACCISQPITQMTLNTFHFAGLDKKSLNQGVPRFNEFMDATKKIKTPYCSAKTILPSLKGLTQLLKKQVCGQSLSDVVTKYCVRNEESEMIPPDEKHARWVHDLYLSMRSKATAPKSKKMKNEPLPVIPYEPYSLVFWILDNNDLLEIASVLSCKLGGKFDVVPIHPDENNNQTAKIVLFTIPQKRVNICPKGSDKNLVFESIAMFCMKLHIRGLKEVTNAYIDSNGISFQTNTLLPIASMSIIDPLSCTSNDIHTVLDSLGVEAALITLYIEMQKVIQFDGNKIHWKYVYLLAESIMHRGYMCPITRHGMGKKKNGVLIRASFETTKEVFLEGATHALKDQMNGITPNIIFANRIPSGTGTFDVFSDNALVANHQNEILQNTTTQSTFWNYLQNAHQIIQQVYNNTEKKNIYPQHPKKKRKLTPKTNKTQTSSTHFNKSPVYETYQFSPSHPGEQSPLYNPNEHSNSPMYDPDRSITSTPIAISPPNSPPTVSPPNSPPTVSPPNFPPTVSPPNSPPTVSPPNSPPTVSPPNSPPTVSPPNSPPTVSPPNSLLTAPYSPSQAPNMSPPTLPSINYKRKQNMDELNQTFIYTTKKQKKNHTFSSSISNESFEYSVSKISNVSCMSSPEPLSPKKEISTDIVFTLKSPSYKNQHLLTTTTHSNKNIVGITINTLMEQNKTPTFLLKSPTYEKKT